MNTAQVIACQLGIYVKKISHLHHFPSKPLVIINPCYKTTLSLRSKPSLHFKSMPISTSEPLHVCLAGGKGMAENNNEDSPWKGLEKAVEKFKGQSIEDVLRQQIKGEEYYDGGGSSGAKPPGGGGGGGGADGPGGSEEESFAAMLDENLQVFLATLGFIFLYIYILTGEEIMKLARDYIKYIFGGSQSIRLKEAMQTWGILYKNLTAKQKVDKYWLEKAILATPTWWNDPDDYRDVVENYVNYLKSQDSNPDEKVF